MTITRDNLGPTAQAYYDAHKPGGRPKLCPKCRGMGGNTTCVLCQGGGYWNPKPSALQPRPPGPEMPAARPQATSAQISTRTRAGITKTKLDTREFLNICDKAGVPKPELEYRFHPTRMWRFDFCWRPYLLALECDGGVWVGGRHNASAGFIKDMEKFNSATTMGYGILHCLASHLLRYETIEMVQRAIRGRKLVIARGLVAV